MQNERILFTEHSPLIVMDFRALNGPGHSFTYNIHYAILFNMYPYLAGFYYLTLLQNRGWQ
jgi:hypothetical protein